MKFLDLTPTAVVCMRGNLRIGITYDAEVKVDGKQYVLATGFKDRTNAQSAADGEVKTLVRAMRAVINSYMSKWPEAKP